MGSNLLFLCLIGHILGDFYLQDEKMAENKKENIKWNFIHGLMYSVPMAVILIIVKKSLLITGILLLIISMHLVIDLSKFYLSKCYEKIIAANGKYKVIKYLLNVYGRSWMVYLLDQLIHIVTIILACTLLKKPINIIEPINILMNIFGANLNTTLKWTFIILCCYKPLNVTFIKLFANYKPVREIASQETSNLPESTKKTGEIIGFLERTLIVIFLHLNQYSSIGLILTAKSIARYDMISRNKEFAEYYLIGTLSSVLFSILLYFIII